MATPTDFARKDHTLASPVAEELIRTFVEHWGVMARAWGINATMGELFALLYITSEAWTADDLRLWLRVSRGNVSMNLRELLAWGVVHKVHVPGERRERFRAETDVWTLFRRILRERKRRELAPTLQLLDQACKSSETDPRLRELRDRIEPLMKFFASIDSLANQLLALSSSEFNDLSRLLGSSESESDSV